MHQYGERKSEASFRDRTASNARTGLRIRHQYLHEQVLDALVSLDFVQPTPTRQVDEQPVEPVVDEGKTSEQVRHQIDFE